MRQAPPTHAGLMGDASFRTVKSSNIASQLTNKYLGLSNQLNLNVVIWKQIF